MGKSRERKNNQFLSLTKPCKYDKILDVGAADKEYSPVDNYLEKNYLWSENITALSIFPLTEFKKKYPSINAVTFSGDNFPFEDNFFSIVASNAVIEHIGSFHKQLHFINEMARVGHKIYFTTPAKEFPVEIHTNYPFIHWFPKKTFDKVVTRLGKGWAAGDYMNLLTRKKLEALLEASNLQDYQIITHRFGPFPIHYIVYAK